MSALTLVIVNETCSSWSPRSWLVLRHGGVPFDEVRVAHLLERLERGSEAA
jgi:glutathione S-transferase